MSVPSNFVEFKYEEKSSEFTQEMLDDICSFNYGFSNDEKKKIFSVEWHVLNKHTGIVSGLDIPGIRDYKTIRSIYFSRFSKASYKKIVEKFFSHLPIDFPKDQIYKFNLPKIRITTPAGLSFYPVNYY